ncbi:Pax transcription activation domain interacting protein [Aphelenchoides avenae]|nr:Pax transcription activation domain interacting protein [Aphelenchus avenae]
MEENRPTTPLEPLDPQRLREMVSSAGTNVAEFQANWTSPPQPGSGAFSSDQRSGSLSDGSPMSVSKQHRLSTGSDLSQHQHQDSPAQPQSQQFGQLSGTPHTPVGYPPSNDFPPPRTPLSQHRSSPSKQVPMGMAMTEQSPMGSPTVQAAHLPQSPFSRTPSVASRGTPASPFPQHFAAPPYSQGSVGTPGMQPTTPTPVPASPTPQSYAAVQQQQRIAQMQMHPHFAYSQQQQWMQHQQQMQQQQQMAQGRMVSPHMAQRPMLMRVPFPGQAYPQPMAFAPRPTPPQYPQPGGAAQQPQQVQLNSPSFGPSFADGVQQRGPPQFYQGQQSNAPPGFVESGAMGMGQPASALAATAAAQQQPQFAHAQQPQVGLPPHYPSAAGRDMRSPAVMSPNQNAQLPPSQQQMVAGRVPQQAPPHMVPQHPTLMDPSNPMAQMSLVSAQRIAAPSQYFGVDPGMADRLDPSLCLAGCVCVFFEDNMFIDRQALTSSIRLHGGEVEHFNPRTIPDRVTHVVCNAFTRNPLFKMILNEGRKRLVTVHWLYDTVAKRRMEPPTRPAHFPHTMGGAASKTKSIKAMLNILGARYTPFLSEHNNLLICTR